MSLYNFDAIAGTNFSTSLNLTNSDGTYINLSGYAAIGRIKNQYSDTGNLFNVNIFIDPSYISGLMVFSGYLPISFPIGKFVYDINISGSNSYVENVLNGYFNVYPNVI